MQKIVLTFAAAALAAAASAYTVYDAGKALRQNCASGAYTGANGDSYYTDENGGKWQFRLSSEQGVFANVTFPAGTYTGYNGKLFAGFALDNTKQSSSVRVNMTDAACAVQNGTVEPNELVMFPANNTAQCAHVRFIAPEAGWYSAFVSAHDLSKETVAGCANSGAKVVVRAQGNLLVYQVVSLEEYPGTTHRFDFQMPVRYLAAGDTVDVIVGGNGAINNDNTGVKFFVTKEDEGRFYDSGIAMTNLCARRLAAAPEAADPSVLFPAQDKPARKAVIDTPVRSDGTISASRLEELSEMEDIRELLFIVQQYLGKTLSPSETRRETHASSINHESTAIRHSPHFW